MRTALATDLYELTMMAGYESRHLEARASFELYVRQLPPHRTFLVAAGLQQAVEFLQDLHFRPDELEWLRTVPNLRAVPSEFFDQTLKQLRFTGDVDAVAEGTPVFPLEPLLRISAPLVEAQLVETTLLAYLTFQTTIASKAARVVHAARGRSVMEFGSRRAHGPEAAVLAARAAYLAGCSSTSNVEAGFRFDIPLSGTMAHSWVTSFEDELEAFRAYAAVYGEQSTFLIDTYDTVEAARKIVASGLRPAAVRIDSGALDTLCRAVRAIFDEGGLGATRILVSGDLDERTITDLLDAGTPVDSFGVGTALSTSKDAPALGGIYKLVEIERAGSALPVMKLSGGKVSHPGRKQVWRRLAHGKAFEDVIGLATEETPANGRPLLAPIMRSGRLVSALPALADSRTHHAQTLSELPPGLRALDGAVSYPVRISAGLEDLTSRTAARFGG